MGGLISGPRKLSPEALADRAARAAAGLASLGIGQGDLVALYLRNDLAILRGQRGRRPARRLSDAGELALHAGRGGLSLRELGGQGDRDPRGPDPPDPRRLAAGSSGPGGSNSFRDRRGLRHGSRPDAGGLPHMVVLAGRLRTARRTGHRSARNHHLHLRNHGPAEGRAPVAAERRTGDDHRDDHRPRVRLHRARAAGRHRHRRHRADVPLGAERLRPDGRAAWRDGDPAAPV